MTSPKPGSPRPVPPTPASTPGPSAVTTASASPAPAASAPTPAAAPSAPKISVPLEQLASVSAVPEDEVISGVQEVKRSEPRAKVDADVLAAHKAWTADGSPALSLTKGKHRHQYIVSPEHADAIRDMLRKAGLFHKLRVTRSIAKPHVQDGKATGNVRIIYTVSDTKPRAPKATDAK